MKKITILGTMLLAAALIFTGCKDNDATNEFDDCTTTVTSDDIVLADGNWTIKAVISADGESSNMTLKATVENGEYTFTSGSGTMTSDVKEGLAEMGITEAQWNSLSNDEKKLLFSMFLPEGASVSFNGTKMTVTATLDAKTLAGLKNQYDLDNLPPTATIKSNDAKDKYVVTFVDEDGDSTTMYISKD